MRDLVGTEVEAIDTFSWHDIQWAAEECTRQRSGEMSVARLIEALAYARKVIAQRGLLLGDIAFLGWLVEPSKNHCPTGSSKGLWRRVKVTIGGVIPLPPPEGLDRKMELLYEAWEPGGRGTVLGQPYLEQSLSADQWYKEFEEIHPFVDGNGRVGSILWNLHRGTLDKPEAPPDLWAESNREAMMVSQADRLIQRELIRKHNQQLADRRLDQEDER